MSKIEKDIEDFIKATAKKFPSFTPSDFRREFEAIVNRKPTVPEVTLFLKETEREGKSASITPMTVGSYTLKELLGSGPFSEVYRGVKGEYEYAIKIVKVGVTGNFEQQFANSVSLQLNSKFVVKYFDTFKGAAGQVVVVMELCPKGDLKSLIDKSKELGVVLSPLRITKILIQVTLGLEAMHRFKILHRDLKPGNILVDNEDNMKIGDFACAIMLETTEDKAHTSIGTPLYESPEVIRGEGYDSSADMWSLGVILYELCTLERPFTHTDRYQLQKVIVSGKYPPIPRDRAPPELIGIVLNLLTNDPKKRLSAQGLLQDPFIRKTAEETGLLQHFPFSS